MKVMDTSTFAIENIEWAIVGNNSFDQFMNYGEAGNFSRVVFTILL